ncbi:cytochrome c [Polynucleobacter sp. UK-Kesae-W10]|uniref:c-type cytochrome n=1 Tax=Polynucleobacter sp. UK-Kesae-W10 TaxID=1819738 RepID=UPI001C0B75C7|nr:c-type cytochrome [Polynucleobacter sp. UK-Kesae-W10]MBU3577410.1 cytochrome c4 [Polynucleobacter sp. UK-Kesae-W10]
MQILRIVYFIFIWALLPISGFAADGEAIMVHGGSNPAAMPCIACHGADGKGMPSSGFPRLSGLPAPYIEKQLYDFRSGARENPVMGPIAKALSDEEIKELAIAYSKRPKVNVNNSTKSNPVQGSGAWIATRGEWNKNIPECTLCHGPDGVGVGDSFPPLAGQSPLYLENQLNAWREQKLTTPKKTSNIPATRHNDPNHLMQHIAASLTEAQIKAVSEYFGSLGDSTEPFDESQHRLR